MIHKFKETPDVLLEYTDASLPEEAFADDINRIFPIKDSEDVIAAFELMKNIPYNQYSTAERLYMLDRIVAAAVANKVDLNFEETLGGEDMFDKNLPEFKEAVAAAVKVEVEAVMADLADEDKRAAAKIEYEKTIKDLLAAKEESLEAVKTAEAGTEAAKQEFKDFKTEIKVKEALATRISELKEAGLELEDWSETEEAVAEMSDKAFALYKNQLAKALQYTEAPENGKPYPPGHPKFKKEDGKDDEDKDAKDKKENPFKKKKAKASDDIVQESEKEGELPNLEAKASINDDLFPATTKWLEAEYGQKVS